MKNTLTALSLVMGAALPVWAADSQTVAGSCEAKYQAIAAAALKLPYWEFDQTEAGWRQLGACPAEAAQLLERYVAKQAREQRGVRWHLAQTLALSGQAARAADEAQQSIDPHEDPNTTAFSWNSYVQATIAFLRNDRARFDTHYRTHQATVDKHAGNKINFEVLTGLKQCFGRPYKEAYEDCRPAP
ncbi:hypothetical protein HNQ51_000463 [Inhella inkyongensis]|uniref:Uncharacterized protein n=1 Tax=Inhella inkyongensis TaxID=392593 RepID=A0A840S3N7_9BURK|nr:hypothetical protein [Inhella inkyongensis]MBB5203170.1 hypothetical protein [Inhella inkyongensis]